uniref:Zinc finger PMZ-type domain-containing protein n=1 Tax=Tanacetum cinerariifolium TaxID=118510 RepID=A0A6L2LQ00_TANCI|nr:hypothetical protein [Tanacetum cinerariifolium]
MGRSGCSFWYCSGGLECTGASVEEGSDSTTMPFTVNLYHNGVFVERPFNYQNDDFKVIDDVDFEGMLYVQMFDIIRRVVLISPTSLFFKLVDKPLIGLKPLKTDEDVEQAVKTPFKCNIDDDAPSTYENLEDLKDIIDFEVEGKENVAIPKNTTDDPWLNKLVVKGNFIGHIDDPTANLGGRFIHKENDPEDDIVDPKCKAKKNIIDVDEGKCAAFKGKKPKDKNHDVDCNTNSDKADCSSKPDHAKYSFKPKTKKNGRTSKAIKERWSRRKNMKKEGLVEHYIKLWEYRQTVLESNPDSELGYGGGLTILYDGHERLVEAVSGAYIEVEVRRWDVAYGVNFHIKKCGYRLWELSGIPCVHAMAAYYRMNMDPELWDNELNVHQVSIDLSVNEAPKNYTSKESQAQDLDLAPTLPIQESQVHTRSKRKKQVATTCMRIYVKTTGRSERIANMQTKKFKFDAST